MNPAVKSLTRFTPILLIVVFSWLLPVKAQVPQLPNGNSPQPIDPNSPNNLHPQSQNGTSLMSLEGGQHLLKDSEDAAAAQKYDVAAKKLQEVRQLFNELSSFYQDLNASFAGIDNRISDSLRKKALEAAQLRDESAYQLALVQRSLNQPELAVPLLIQIIKSQNPTRDLGKKAYQQLVDLGFADVPYIPGSDPKTANSTQPPSQNSSSSNGSGILSIQSGQNLLKDSDNAVSAQKYDVASKKLQQARQLFNQLSSFYQDLNASFSGIDNRVSDSLRKKALDTAQLRDESAYRLALVHRALNQSDLAVPLLVQIIKSQNPTRDLGKKAYQQLLELGFADAPFPRPRAN